MTTLAILVVALVQSFGPKFTPNTDIQEKHNVKTNLFARSVSLSSKMSANDGRMVSLLLTSKGLWLNYLVKKKEKKVHKCQFKHLISQHFSYGSREYFVIDRKITILPIDCTIQKKTNFINSKQRWKLAFV